METASNDDEKQEVPTNIDVSEVQFFGVGYSTSNDRDRLKGALRRVFVALSDPTRIQANGEMKFKWWTLADVSKVANSPEASVSASIRTLRNQYGFIIDRKRKEEGSGVHLYRLTGKDPSRIKKKGKKPLPSVGDRELWEDFLHFHDVWKNQPSTTNRLKAQYALDAWNNNLFN